MNQGFFSGQYNSVSGKVKKESTGEVLYEISGQWSSEIYIKMAKVQMQFELRNIQKLIIIIAQASNKTLFFDVKSSSIHPKVVRNIDEQEPLESRR